MADTCVQVALRIRPLVPAEKSRGCKNALDVYQDLNQVQISEKAFTFNHVFNYDTSQEAFYKQSVAGLLPNLFKGYNLTILAYGQTGSGKTHSMGTAYNGHGEMGIIPRAVHDIFAVVKDNFSYDFNITVAFVELYQEVLYDLLSSKPREQCVLEVREDANKGIFIPGLTELPAHSAQEVLDFLQHGSKGRATSSTNMNSQSSRSHAIFTINIAMTEKGTADCKTAKFHLVDLAGSERPKKTGATGQTFKEGININKGLFVLGNVISALGDEKGAPAYVNFRESNLTRLLKDSLGGNSVTMMIACVSPADYNAEETVSTLRYADRAKRIRNKPVVNEDAKAAEIGKLLKTIQQLKLQLSAQGGPAVPQEEVNNMKTENTNLKNQLHVTVSQNLALHERVLLAQTASDGISQKFHWLQDKYGLMMQQMKASLQANELDPIRNHLDELTMIEAHLNAIDDESKRSEAELKHYERSVANDVGSVNYISDEEIAEQQESHAAKQIAINEQIEHVTKMLAQKEKLAKDLASSSLYMVDTAEMEGNKNKIAELESEKADLLAQLKQAQSTTGKLSEQRRKRVQDLEAQLKTLNRKVQEQSRLIQLKKRDDQKIVRLNQEITGMKSEKVKLVRTMRQEADRFRKWKLDRERELSKLQNQDRKRQNELAAMKRKHSTQEKVWKRKLEEAAASSKRLKDALALRKTVQDSKLKGKIERLGPWIQQELNIHANIVVAQATIKTLLDDRSALQAQVDKLKESEDDNGPEIQRAEEQIEMLSIQLQELNQKLIESSDLDRLSNRFDNVQTMAEAKYVLQALFDLTADFKKAEIEKEHKVDELTTEAAEMKLANAGLQKQIAGMRSQHAESLSEIEKDYEEKTLLLLKQLRGVHPQGADVNEQLQHRLDAQEEINARLEAVVEELQTENDALRKLTAPMEAQQLQEEMTTEAAVEESSAYRTPPKKRRCTSDDKENLDKVPRLRLEACADESFEDDVDKDPDWRNTPLGKQVRAVRQSSMAKAISSMRRVSGGCGCKGNCGTRVCACKKIDRSCSSACKCKHDKCKNREEANDDAK